MDDEALLRADAVGGEDAVREWQGEREAHCEWREALGGAVNALAVSGGVLAAGCSDGCVRVWRRLDDGQMRPVHALRGHEYPVLAVDFGANGALLLSAGLDGEARLWDVEVGAGRRGALPLAATLTPRPCRLASSCARCARPRWPTRSRVAAAYARVACRRTARRCCCWPPTTASRRCGPSRRQIPRRYSRYPPSRSPPSRGAR